MYLLISGITVAAGLVDPNCCSQRRRATVGQCREFHLGCMS